MTKSTPLSKLYRPTSYRNKSVEYGNKLILTSVIVLSSSLYNIELNTNRLLTTFLLIIPNINQKVWTACEC